MKKILLALSAALAVILCFSSCDPAADHLLSAREKEADIIWMFSIFRNYYAPLQYKEGRYKFDMDRLEKKYISAAKRTKNNEEMYQLQTRLIAEFRDAHTSGSIRPASMPGQARIAYLGFSAQRDGEAVRVTSILPTIDATKFPIQIGDRITKIDGMPIFKYIDKYLTPYRDLGNPLANKTMHAQNLFSRMSLSLPMPEKLNAKLTVERSPPDPHTPKVTQVELPWVTRDLYDFQIDQAVQKAAKQSGKAVMVVDPATKRELELVALDQRGKALPFQDMMDRLTRKPRKFFDSFKVDAPVSWALRAPQADVAPALSGIGKLALERDIPANAISIEEAKAYPAYFYSLDVRDAKGVVRGKKKVGYIRIDSFEPAGDEDSVVAEVKTTLAKFKANGVATVVVDTIDNPGGSLTLAAKISQAFSDKKVKLADMQIGLNDNWLSQFEQGALSGSDHVREYDRRIAEDLRKSKNQGLRLSKNYNMEDIMPFTLHPNYGTNFDNIYVLTNEMNASCGDIFPAIMQDNGLATIVGTNTMGAGGNVVEHQFDQAPNGHFTMRQTESLIVRKDGTYLENNGVKPDVEIDMNKGAFDKFASVRTDVEALILKKPEPKAPKLASSSSETPASDCAEGFSALGAKAPY